MTPHEHDADQLLGALGELQRAQRAELARLEEPARELAAREPERARALEARLTRELFDAPAAQRRGPGRVARRSSLAAAGCAMAAATLLWVRAPSSPFELAYTLVPPAPDAAQRALPAEPAAGGSYSLGRELVFVLRPAARHTGLLRVLAYAAHGDVLLQLAPDVELDPAGGARVILDTRDTQLSEGSWELLFYVSPQTVTAVSEAELRSRNCPSATRCLAFSAKFVQPRPAP